MRSSRLAACVLAIVVSLLARPDASALDTLIQEVETGCRSEIDTLCKRVTPGQGRILACLYAHTDRLSGKCEYALYDAAVQLERAIGALAYVASECDEYLEEHCAGTDEDPLECLKRNAPHTSARCQQAIRQTGL